MSDPNKDAEWEVVQDRTPPMVRCTGRWNLLTRGSERHRLETALGRLSDPAGMAWDLRGVEAMDSAGALVLWNLWGRRQPEALECRSEHRHWFERLERRDVPRKPRSRPWWSPLAQFGAALVTFSKDAVGIVLLVGQLMLDLGYSLRRPRLIPWREIFASIHFTGATALPLLGAMAGLIGMVMTYQLGMAIRQFGANTMIINLLGLSVLRELGPMAAALVVIGRTGSSITASIGVMHITEEFDALRAFGASPTQRLILPKVIGMAISIPLLVVWTDFIEMLAGMVTAQASLGVSYKLFLERLPVSVPWINFWIGLSKGVLFGMVIATLSSYFGLKIRPNTDSLRRENTNAVVANLTVVLLMDATLGALLAHVGLV